MAICWCISFKTHTTQFTTGSKRGISDSGDTTADSHVDKVAAVIERIVSDGADIPIADSDTCQAATVIERGVSDVGNTVGDRDTE